MMYKRIKELRVDKDLSQKDMGLALGFSQRSYAYYEAGERTVPPEVLAAIALYHRVSTDYLLELTDNKEPYPRKKERSN